MGGEIWLESAPGRGSQFFFTARFTPAPPRIEVHSMTQPADLAGIEVLAVDDNQVNRELLNHLLPQWGLRPTIVSDPQEALRLFEQSVAHRQPFPLVLLDQNMPGMSGVDLAQRIARVAAPRLPGMLILSSSPLPADSLQANDLGIRYLAKPLRRSALQESIRLALGAAASSHKKPAPAHTPSRTLQVLLVEDNLVNQKLSERLLTKMAHHVTLAVNGRQAVDLVSGRKFDLILMDIQMPVMSGIEATRLIRDSEAGSGRHVPIIAMTAHAMAGDAEKFFEAGMDGYVSKPVRPNFLCAEIDRLTSAQSTTEIQPMNAPNDPTAALGVNLAELLDRVDHDRELLRDLLLIFKEEFPRYFQALQEAVSLADTPKVASVSHALKGMLSNLAATRAAACAAELEQLARAKKVDCFAKALVAFEHEALGLVPEMETYLVEAQP
jgi:CheY-like chemotaxis protein/HPt (histidine-containing phosphotransfer) domain-containing protein